MGQFVPVVSVGRRTKTAVSTDKAFTLDHKFLFASFLRSHSRVAVLARGWSVGGRVWRSEPVVVLNSFKVNSCKTVE